MYKYLPSGMEKSWEMKKVSAAKSLGWKKFLSHEKYRELAKDHGERWWLNGLNG